MPSEARAEPVTQEMCSHDEHHLVSSIMLKVPKGFCPHVVPNPVLKSPFLTSFIKTKYRISLPTYSPAPETVTWVARKMGETLYCSLFYRGIFKKK